MAAIARALALPQASCRFSGDFYDIMPRHKYYEPWIVLCRALALKYPYDETFRGYVRLT